MNNLLLSRNILSVGDITDMVSAESCGAVSIFVGTTRNNFESKRVLSLEYEAYESMAVKQMEAICKELRNQWPDIVNIAIHHRLGLVPVSEISVVIAISSPHRKTALEAVAAAIDEFKKRVPIWKKEIYDNEEFAWKENKEYGSKLFDGSMCKVNDSTFVPNNMVQISVCEDEIKRRIQCFIEKKRNEIDLSNIIDFEDIKPQSMVDTEQFNTGDEQQYDKSVTCARINSKLVKQEHTKGHLKVKQVKNYVGPQMRPNYLNTLDKLMNSEANVYKIRHERDFAFQERLENIEQLIDFPQSNIKDIYQHLKDIENRILYLESVSPEYRHFLVHKIRKASDAFESANALIPPTELSALKRKIYAVSDIDAIINLIEN